MDAIVSNEPARGFSLIEIAVVIAIVMTLITLGLGLMNAQISSAATSVTKKRQEAIKDALIAYLGANRRLPCPDAPNNTNGVVDISGITGDEDRQGSTPAGVCVPTGGTASFGVVPFRTLGLSREMAMDGWSNFFSYQVYTTPASLCPGTPPINDWSRTDCFGAGKDGSIFVFDGDSPITNRAIAVIISHGANGLGAWAAQSTQNVAPATTSSSTCEERKNSNGNLSGCTAPLGVTAPHYYFKGERQDQDDVVAWVDGREAINALAKQGVIKSATAQVNDDLQTLADMALGAKRAGITISVPPCSPEPCNTPPPAPTAGCGTPVDLNSVLASMRDPWGVSYVVDDASGSFPICIYSKGGGSETCQQSTCITTTPTPPSPPAICKSIDRVSFNSYLAKAGSSGCP